MDTNTATPTDPTTPTEIADFGGDMPAPAEQAAEQPAEPAADFNPDAVGDFNPEAVGDFGGEPGGGFSGSIQGEQKPDTTGTPQAPAALDDFLKDVDMRDPTAEFAAGKPVDFAGTLTRIEPFTDKANPKRKALKLHIMPESPPVARALGAQVVYCDITGEKAVRGKQDLRAWCLAAGKPLSADGTKLANGQGIHTIAGSPIKGSISKANNGGLFINPPRPGSKK